MPRILITIENLPRLQRQVNRYPEISRKHADKAIKNSIAEIERQTKPITPVKTGRLVGNWQSIFRPFKGTFFNETPYAVAVHDLHPPGQRYRNPSLNKRAIAGFLEVGAKRALPVIERQIQKASDNITRDLAK